MGYEVIELWREPRVVQVVGLGRSTLWSLVKDGEFPAPVPIHDGGRAVGWPSNEVISWVQNRIAAARTKAE
ncbi:MAG: AlpA family phage regulatory protein [Betaproteobacteria bacterium]|nr:AlpA family phage regulatory protein [Betaproteobacteria bacterium]